MPINKETIISVFDEKLTLMQWLKTINKALEDAVLTGVEVRQKGNATYSFVVTFEDGTELESNEFVLAQGESINGATIRNGHLYLSLTNGDELDAGNLFSGNVNIDGTLNATKVTGDEIVENMSGYSIEKVFPSSYGSLSLDYAGVCKNGNKITFAVAGKIIYNSTGINNGGANIINFIIPEEIGQKLFPTNIGNQSNLLYLSTVNMYGENNTFTAGRGRVTKNNNTTLPFLIYSAGMSTDLTYSFRIEATFLLSDNLAV